MNFICNLLIKLFIIYVYFNQIVNSVVVTEINLLSLSGKTDYVLSGESYHLTCVYLLEQNESVQQILWDLNGRVIYVHKADLPKPVASGIFVDRVDYSSKSTNSMSINNASKEMAGRYTCHVLTNLTSTAVTITRQVYIIIDSCTQQKYKTHSDMINCKEQISLSCNYIFPKPMTACALYNDYTNSIIKAETINRIHSNKDHTFNLSIFANYDIEEIKALNVPVSFRCKLSVEGTSWRKSFIHSLFAESVCLLENDKQSMKSFLIRQKKPNNYLFNESQVLFLNKEPSCLVGYREGSIIKATCLSSQPLLLCINATWSLIDKSSYNNLNLKIQNKEKIDWTKLIVNRNSDVRCSTCHHYLNTILLILIIIFNYYHLLPKLIN